jgi:hypothetical protein
MILRAFPVLVPADYERLMTGKLSASPTHRYSNFAHRFVARQAHNRPRPWEMS